MKNRLFTLCVPLLVMGGCVKGIIFDTRLERKVVVEFVLTDDSIENLYLSLTGEPGEKVAPPCSGGRNKAHRCHREQGT